jgi:nitrogen fixation-related uncharacterized protein
MEQMKNLMVILVVKMIILTALAVVFMLWSEESTEE